MYRQSHSGQARASERKRANKKTKDKNLQAEAAELNLTVSQLQELRADEARRLRAAPARPVAVTTNSQGFNPWEAPIHRNQWERLSPRI